MSLGERFTRLWNRVQARPRELPTMARIANERVLRTDSAAPPSDVAASDSSFVADRDYFQVRINELFLLNQREWFSDWDPMVVTSTDFLYKDHIETLPYLVGPSMIANYASDAPTGMVFTNTTVAGPHPYRGGALKLTIILGRLKREDYLRRSLEWLDKAIKTFDFATAIAPYLKVAELVIESVDGLLGSSTENALIGLRTEIDPDAGDRFEPGYYALISKPGIRPDFLWVRDQQLYYGEPSSMIQPFRDADYVLYSIARISERGDIIKLPFYADYEKMISLAMQSTTDVQWNVAKASMATLSQTLQLSPDLTHAHAAVLRDRYTAEMIREYKKAVAGVTLHATRRLDSDTLEAVKILAL
jgi:hypothetical protein